MRQTWLFLLLLLVMGGMVQAEPAVTYKACPAEMDLPENTICVFEDGKAASTLQNYMNARDRLFMEEIAKLKGSDVEFKRGLKNVNTTLTTLDKETLTPLKNELKSTAEQTTSVSKAFTKFEGSITEKMEQRNAAVDIKTDGLVRQMGILGNWTMLSMILGTVCFLGIIALGVMTFVALKTLKPLKEVPGFIQEQRDFNAQQLKTNERVDKALLEEEERKRKEKEAEAAALAAMANPPAEPSAEPSGSNVAMFQEVSSEAFAEQGDQTMLSGPTLVDANIAELGAVVASKEDVMALNGKVDESGSNGSASESTPPSKEDLKELDQLLDKSGEHTPVSEAVRLRTAGEWDPKFGSQSPASQSSSASKPSQPSRLRVAYECLCDALYVLRHGASQEAQRSEAA